MSDHYGCFTHRVLCAMCVLLFLIFIVADQDEADQMSRKDDFKDIMMYAHISKIKI